MTSASKFDSSSTIPLWLDGKEITTSTTFEVVSPLDHKPLYKSSSASEQDVEAAVRAAEKALPAWSKTKPNQRRDIFLKAADEFERRRDELWEYSHSNTGAAESMFGFEFGLATNACRDVAGIIGVVQGSIPESITENTTALQVREPYGVCLGIAPWNAPYVLGLRACLQPLAMGNTVILKGSETSPAVYWAIASVLHAAGLPAGVLNTIIHRPSDASQITTALVAHPSIKKINFTGSTTVGSIIASLAGKHLKPTIMELGGKAPSIVCEDADVNTAAMQCALGAFLHAGQICMATERIIVHEAIVDKFKPALKATLDNLFSDSAMGVPQLVTAAPVEKNKKLLADAVSKGAGVVYGDPAANEKSKTQMRPVVLEKISEDMDIYHTESFGPTVALYTVKSDDEAVKIANDTDYGLSSAVFTEDLRRGLRIAKQIETGAVHINGMTVHDESLLPHGGAKKSGFGRFNGVMGLEEWSRTKIITWKD